MTLRYSVAVRNARQAARETTIGTSPKLRIYSGAEPASAAAALAGNTMLVEIPLPSDWLAAPANGATDKSGTWSGTGVAGGAATFFRIYDNAGTTCHEQGTIAAAAGAGVDMVLDNVNIAIGQAVAVNSYTTTDGNA